MMYKPAATPTQLEQALFDHQIVLLGLKHIH